MTKLVRVAKVSDLSSGQFKSVEIESERIALFNVDGTFYAMKDVCTHDGGTLTGGTLNGYSIECPRHGAQFDVRTGSVLRMPAYVGIETFPVEVKDDEIFIRFE
jgi:3-phenylpropionate/trans-cinnamate dioxygenase ferredoxin subunit